MIVELLIPPELSSVRPKESGTYQLKIIEAGLSSGGGTDGTITNIVTNTAIGGHRAVVYVNGIIDYASNQTPTHATNVIGISMAAVNAGDTLSIKTIGLLVEPSWSWAVNTPIFVGTNGLLTQTPPTTGFTLIIAMPITPTTIFIKQQSPYIRN